MKTINKTPGPNGLTQFAEANPNGRWDADFKNYNGGNDYQVIRNQIIDDQGGLCAYCEVRIINLPPHKQRIEHFHSKSDLTDPDTNWALDWKNIIGVCIGGDDSDKKLHPLPENLSCDSYKNYLITKKKLPEACEGLFINPLKLAEYPCLFDFDKATGRLRPNMFECREVNIEGNQLDSTQALVQKTIDVLNLNCDRLIQQRRSVLHQYNKLVAEARKRNDKQCFSKMAAQWFQNQWPQFFTIRRILLGEHAEVYLEQIEYKG